MKFIENKIKLLYVFNANTQQKKKTKCYDIQILLKEKKTLDLAENELPCKIFQKPKQTTLIVWLNLSNVNNSLLFTQ